MSQTSPGNSQTPAASQQASSQALLDELRVAADRARDERLKLARLVKHSADLPLNAPQQAGNAGPADQVRISTITDQFETLEQAVADKLAALEQVQQDIDNRAQYLESLRHTITDTTRAFVNQVEQAQHFKAHIDAAKQHVRMSAGRVAEEVRTQLSGAEAPIVERIGQLKELDKAIDQRIARMQQMHKQANEAVDKHLLGALQAAKEQAADMAGPMKAEIDKYIADQRSVVEAAIYEKIAELDVDVEEALRPLTDRFNHIILDANQQADLLADMLPDRLAGLGDEHLDSLREKLVDKAKAIIDGVDEQTMEQAGQIIHETIAAGLDKYLSEAEEASGGYVDGLIAKLDEAQAAALERYRQSITEFDQVHVADREQAFAKLDEEMQRVQALADERIEHARAVLEEATDGIHARTAAAVDAAMRSADKKLEDFEAATVDHLRAIDDGIEHGIEASRKLLVDHEKEARKQGEACGEAAIRMAQEGVAEAQRRLAGFESGITQRIALANKAADDAVAAIDERVARAEAAAIQRIAAARKNADDAVGSIDQSLAMAEQDASRRIMQMVELAETSGNAIADSINELSRSAEDTAAQAQMDLDEKLRAFEHISAEALRTAEETLRQNIGELRDSSRAMIEMVSRQVKAQANEIEPQTREVISQSEQHMRRRIGELRDAAQGMVDITVSRLESQLEQVKAKAQKTAFEGIDTPKPAPPAIDPQQGNEAA